MHASKRFVRGLAALVVLATLVAFGAPARAYPGDVDPGFNAGTFSSQFFQRTLNALAVQPDGKVLIGGGFNVVAGVSRNTLARLNANGSLDLSFVPPPFSQDDLVAPVRIAVQPDGKIIVVGNAFRIAGTLYSVIRLNADGSLDPAFSLSVIDGTVQGLALQPDGKILIGGDFSSVANTERRLIARLNANGTLDAGFSLGASSAAGLVYSMALQPDGKVVVGGGITLTVGTTTLQNVIRVAANGTPEMTFKVAGDSLDAVQDVLIGPGGKIYIAGNGSANVGSRNPLARLNSDGTLDTSFTSAVTGPKQVRAIVLEPSGKIIGVGNFCTAPLEPGCAIARFNTDGSRDTFYPFPAPTCPYPGPDDTPAAVVRQADGNVLVGGSFSTVSCTPHERVVRLLNDIGITIDNVTLSEGNSGTTPFTFTVRLSAPSAQTVSVSYATSDGSASAASDYQAASGTLSFAPGETAKPVTVLVKGDTTVEPNETFKVTLSAPVNAIIAAGLGTGTILNDDACSYTVSPLVFNLPAAGATGNAVAVTTTSACAWTASSSSPFVMVTSGASGTGSGTVTFTVPANAGAARSGSIVVAGQTVVVNQGASVMPVKKTAYDFDGDGKADISIYRPGPGKWFVLGSAAGFLNSQFGLGGDKIVPADYDGDGKTDYAIYRPATGTWYLLRSGAGFFAKQFGLSTDIPVPGDYDGDGKADIAIYRPSNGTWYIVKADGSVGITQFGLAGDIPVPADYDGDGITDIAIYRPSNGTWYMQKSTAGFASTQFGFGADIPVPADYDGDGKADIAVYRPGTGTWFLLQSSAGFATSAFGNGTDIPVPASLRH